MARRREEWAVGAEQIAPERYVFIDESGAKTNMTPLYGRSFDGARLVDHAPHGHWQMTTMVGALRLDGVGACMTLDGALDSAAFDVYVERFLCPTLRPGDVVVADNLSSHGASRAQSAIARCGARFLWLPPYSPDLNPIEKMWSKVKQFLRKAKARTYEALQDGIRSALLSVTAQDAKAWFASCGYGQMDV